MRALKWSLPVMTLFLITDYIHAQYDFRDGYIVTNENDTVYGEIHYGTPDRNASNCYFRYDSASKVINYTPEQIQAYGFKDSKIYLSKNVLLNQGSHRFFLEYLLNGIVNLYYLNSSGVVNFYIEIDSILYPLTNEKNMVQIDNTTYSKYSKKYVGSLTYLFQDAGFPASKIAATEFNHTSLINISKDYHEKVCGDEECIIYYKEQEKLNDAEWQFLFGIYMEYVANQLTMDSYFFGNAIYYSIRNPDVRAFILDSSNAEIQEMIWAFVPGIYFTICRNRQLSLQFELKYQNLNYSKIELKKILIPVIVQYDLIIFKKIIPFINVGFITDINLDTKLNNIYYAYKKLEGFDIDDNAIYSDQFGYLESPDINNTVRSGMSIGTGIKYWFSDKYAAKLEFRVSSSNQEFKFAIQDDLLVHSNLIFGGISVSLGFTF